MSARYKKWRGKEVAEEVKRNVAKAFGEFGLRAEGHAKRELRKGHGVITGTLRRSIHTAQPGYDWGGDHVDSGPGSPERGGTMTEALVDGENVSLEFGSGLQYALPVHQGHHSFEGYHFLTNGIDKAKHEMPGVLKKYEMKG